MEHCLTIFDVHEMKYYFIFFKLDSIWCQALSLKWNIADDSCVNQKC